mgnify:CR=1 FL=1
MPTGIYRRTKEIRKILSEAHKGYKMPDSQKQKIREASIRNGNKPPSFKGKTFSKKIRKQISERMKKRIVLFESIEKMRLSKIGKKHTEEHRKNISKGLKGRKCSIETRKKISLANSGSNNFHWKGGITKKHLAIRNTLRYRLWREGVFKRDNWTCVLCKKIGGILNADHIKSFSKYKKLRFSISNGRTLCVPCHKNTDNFGIKAKYERI